MIYSRRKIAMKHERAVLHEPRRNDTCEDKDRKRFARSAGESRTTKFEFTT